MADDAVLERVRKLLAKAESTSFEPEALALFAKAQQLMQAHAITQAMLAKERGSDRKPIVFSVTVPAPYAREKAALLHQVARANRCRTVMDPLPGTGGMVAVDLFGFADDAEYVRSLWTALLVHAVEEVMRLSSNEEGCAGGALVEVRRSFLIGYSVRIGERLREANRAGATAAGAEPGSSAALALIDRESRVEALLQERYPRLGTARSRVGHIGSYVAGRAAGSRADLGGPRLAGAKGALIR